MTAAAARHDYAPASCGGLRTQIAGTEVVLRASGAMWVDEDEALIVSDLHLEKGSSYAARGQLLPPYDTRETLGRLEFEVATMRPKVLVFLGDTFHDRRSEERLAPSEAARLRLLASGRTLIWVIGNHDADGPQQLPGEPVETLSLGDLTLRHEPLAGPRLGELAGHLHPCAKVAAAGGVVRRRCFVTDGERAILPAFGAYAGGLNIRDVAFAGMFARTPIAAALGAGRVHAVGWKSLRGD